MASVCNVTNASQSTRLLASTTLRTILGTKTLQVGSFKKIRMIMKINFLGF